MTLLEKAKKGILTEEIKKAAAYDGIEPSILLDNIKKGRSVLPKNKNHSIKSLRAIGSDISTKVNANIGTSSECINTDLELEKLKIAVDYGADSIMDLSTGGNLKDIREKILEKSPVMVGAVPTYSLATKLANKNKTPYDFSEDELFDTIEYECSQGIDYITVHCGITYDIIKNYDISNRLCGIVSRGGSILANWMFHNKKNNPLFEHFDRLLDIAYKYDVTLSLGDALRPGSIYDSGDYLQISELLNLSILAKEAYKKNVQVMIEGPGHVPLNEIAAHIKEEKKLCNGAPFYVLGPLPTDIAAGFDHIASAVGSSIAAANGADFLCYVTPAEHLTLPNINDVYEGVVASKIAAHIGDISKGIESAKNKDYLMSKYRKEFNWEKMFELVFDRKKAEERYKKNPLSTCDMCGKLCAVKLSKTLEDT
ncbi:MAG: phosphomethylpyrimidine synthase ThiC [Deferribacterota bacterium]|nr:phosphomethylpyrimidine synthase ThiC [Deferribacterota bacterium]